MLCLRVGSLSPAWSDFRAALFRDLRPLGHSLHVEPNDELSIKISVLDPDESEEDKRKRWEPAHRAAHHALLKQRSGEILAFEEEFAPLFVDMASFEPSTVNPVLQVIDFKNDDHKKIVERLAGRLVAAWGCLFGIGVHRSHQGYLARPYLQALDSRNAFATVISAGHRTTPRRV
jgi:hypothetical protein